MQQTATSNGTVRQNEQSHRTRRQSAPAISFTRSTDSHDEMMLARERQKLQNLRIAHGMMTNLEPEQNGGQGQVEDPAHIGAGGRRVSFIPIVEETILSPLREEADIEEE